MVLLISRRETPITTLAEAAFVTECPLLVALRAFRFGEWLNRAIRSSFRSRRDTRRSIALLLASIRHTFQGEDRASRPNAEWIEGLGTPLPKQLTPYVESDEDAERL